MSFMSVYAKPDMYLKPHIRFATDTSILEKEATTDID